MADGSQVNGVRQTADFPAVSIYSTNIFGNLFEIAAQYRPPIKPIGRGENGIVCSVLKTETNELVAIKKIANAFDNHMDAKRSLREIKLMRHLDHENAIAIRDVVPPPLRLISLMFILPRNSWILTFTKLFVQIKVYLRSTASIYQILQGLKYIHSANVIHRDLKPSNLLLNANCDLKICDFGLARPTSENEFMTEYVVTRWYRAPVLLLNSSGYTAE